MEAIISKALGEDVTQLAAEEKQRLLSRLAHEIRNPLSSLDIHVQLLEEDLTHIAPETKEKLSSRLVIIHGELHRLDNIVKQFLRLAGPSALDLASLDIAKVIGHVRNLLQPEAAARQIELVTHLAEELPSVMADADQLTELAPDGATGLKVLSRATAHTPGSGGGRKRQCACTRPRPNLSAWTEPRCFSPPAGRLAPSHHWPTKRKRCESKLRHTFWRDTNRSRRRKRMSSSPWSMGSVRDVVQNCREPRWWRWMTARRSLAVNIAVGSFIRPRIILAVRGRFSR